MNRLRIILAMLVAVAIAIYIPNVSWAQSGQPGQATAYQNSTAGQPDQSGDPGRTGQTGRPIPQPKGGIATVIRVDQPDNCLRVRSGPGGEYEVIGCAPLGEQLNITGVWTSNNWAQTADNGWVYGPQIQTDLRPSPAAYSRVESYDIDEGYPLVNYWDSYLPDYGYDTFWYGGVPLFLYNVNVWRKFHPWWLRRNWNGHQRVWNQNPAFRQNMRTGKQANVTPGTTTQRNFARSRSNVSSTNLTPLNTNRIRSGSANVVRSGSANLSTKTFSSPNTVRSRTFSSPNISTRSFSSSNFSTRSFSSPTFSTRSFSSPSIGARSFSAGRVGGVGGVGRRR